MANYYNEMYDLINSGQAAPISQLDSGRMYSSMNNANARSTRLAQLQKLQQFENQQKLYDPSFWAQAFGSYSPSVSSTPSAYDAKLNSLMSNPDSIANSAGYKFRLDQGNQAIQRSAAAKGMLGSGNTLAELLRYGQGEAAQEYGNEVGRLTTLRGQDLNLQAMREKAALDAKNNFMSMMSQQMFKSLNQPTY